MSTETNLLPFICEAFGHNKKIRRDIDRLYKIKKYEFYRLARESEIYNHIIIREGDIHREEYAKKALGILLYLHENPQDTEIMKKLTTLIRKGWTRVYMWVQNHEMISVGKYLYSGTKSGNYKTDDDFNTDMLMLIWFALLKERELKQDEIFARIRQVLHQRLEHSSENSKTRYSRKTMEEDLLQDTHKLKQRIYDTYGPVNSYDTIFHGHDDVFAISEPISLIADTESISIPSVFNDVKFSNDDVDETLGIYYMYNKNKNTGEAVKHLVHGLILKGMCKAYKQVKQHYFENNKETVFIDLENQEKELQRLTEDNNILNKKLSNAEKRIQEIKSETEERYKKKIWELSNRVRCLEEELEKEKESNQELTALREFLFSLDRGLVLEKNRGCTGFKHNSRGCYRWPPTMAAKNERIITKVDFYIIRKL
ncbi:MAG: hypothetical protein RQM92_09365 [Candidatus Syntrophopropionicum ammoniitolerans]